MANWIPLESNPDVMNVFLAKLGVPSNVQVVDVFSLDPDMLGFVPQPVAALMLLFPDDGNYEAQKRQQEDEIKSKGQSLSENLFFLKQFVGNACGTIALIHSIANIEGLELKDGHLKQFLDEAKKLDPVERGHLLENAQYIADAHREVANQGQTAPPDEEAPVPYHFIAFVEKDGSLYELDGSKSFPINHGPSSRDGFLENAAKICKNYMERNPNNVNFTICAVTQ